MDSEQGFIERILVKPVNVSEVKHLKPLVKGLRKGRRACDDKGFASKEKRDLLKENKLKDGIMHKAVGGKGLSDKQKKLYQFPLQDITIK